MSGKCAEEATRASTTQKSKGNIFRRFFSALGPGVITGAADDDPSGIATYSVAGAQLGTSMLWTAFLTWPLMGCVQMMCARIGMVTGQGLAHIICTQPMSGHVRNAVHNIDVPSCAPATE